MWKTVITGVLCAVLAGALGFWGGVTYQKTQTPTLGANFRNGNGGPPAGFDPSQMPGGGQAGQNGNARRFAGGIATGTVLSVESQSLTLKLASGGSKTVYLTSDTRIAKSETLKASDIKVGDNVAAMGQASNGGINARTVQIVPEGTDFRGGMGF